jgi:hypothetical protein
VGRPAVEVGLFVDQLANGADVGISWFESLTWLVLQREADEESTDAGIAVAEDVSVYPVVERVTKYQQEVDPIIEAWERAVDPLREWSRAVRVGVDASWGVGQCASQVVNGAVRELGEQVQIRGSRLAASGEDGGELLW